MALAHSIGSRLGTAASDERMEPVPFAGDEQHAENAPARHMVSAAGWGCRGSSSCRTPLAGDNATVVFDGFVGQLHECLLQ